MNDDIDKMKIPLRETNAKEDYNNREELKIKDLLIKIQILKNGVLEERKKNSDLEKENGKLKTRFKEFEKQLSEKENEVIFLSKEKFEVQSELVKQRQKQEQSNNTTTIEYTMKNFIGNLFQSNTDTNANQNENDTKKLHDEITDLKYENDLLKKKSEEENSDFDRCKIEYQKMLTLQTSKMKQLEGTINEKAKETLELRQRQEIMTEHCKKSDIEKTHNMAQIQELTKENKKLCDKVVESLLIIENKQNEIEYYIEALHRHEVESTELARKLAELKNAILEENIVMQTYKCEKICSFLNTELEITFGRTEENECMMKLKEEGQDEEFISVGDIEYLRENNNIPDRVDICYIKNAKAIKFSVRIQLYAKPHLIKAYKDFTKKAMLDQNSVIY